MQLQRGPRVRHHDGDRLRFRRSFCGDRLRLFRDGLRLPLLCDRLGLRLLRDGLTIRAHVMRLRPHRTMTGEINGALLDCVIPVAPRRTYMGSIWLSEGAEALRLSRQGRVQVLCLPRAPGTWRVIEEVKASIRYDRMGPMQQIPHEV